MPRTLKLAKSSNIKSAVLGDDGVLEVTFQNDQKARYANFKAELMDDWEKDSSAGSWFHRNVRQKPDAFPQIKDDAPAASAPKTELLERALAEAEPGQIVVGGKAGKVETVLVKTEDGARPLTPAERANAALTADGVVVTEEKCTDVVRATAREAYDAYVRNAGGLNYEGKPCPKWEDLTPAVRGHWCAAVIAASHNLQKPLLDELEQLRRRVTPWRNRKA